jgi:flavin-dependent dehydrogenase
MRNTAVIIGAGPGGAAAAVRLAQRGVKDVVLVDKDRFPREKTCGSALSPNGLKMADELGIGVDVKRLGYPIHSLRVVTPGKREMHLTTAEGAAVVLLRKHFDNLLVERARTLGVDFRGDFRPASFCATARAASSACAARIRRSSPTTSSPPMERTRSSRPIRGRSGRSRR